MDATKEVIFWRRFNLVRFEQPYISIFDPRSVPLVLLLEVVLIAQRKVVGPVASIHHTMENIEFAFGGIISGVSDPHISLGLKRTIEGAG